MNLVPVSMYYNEVLNLIMEEVRFIFPNSNNFIEYILGINSGIYYSSNYL